MRNALHTVAESPSCLKSLNIHLNDNYATIIARNILITQIITAEEFSPSNQHDIQYVWDVWYSGQWTDATAKRFLKDVDQLLTGQWKTNSSIVIRDADVRTLEDIWSFWKTTVAGMNVNSYSSILKQRCVVFE